MDCKLIICELMNELKSAKLSFIEEQLAWHGADRKEITRAIKTLQERGVIYQRKNGIIEMTEPLNT